MGMLRRIGVYAIVFFFISHLSLSSHANPEPEIEASSRFRSSVHGDIHDILPLYNIPKGILPDAVKSFTFSSEDGSFTVNMKHTCYVKFDDDQLVYYDNIIKGKLTSGRISQVSGIQAKKLFIWLSVTGLDVDSDSDMVEFHVGAFSRKFPAQQFQEIPTCIKKNKFKSFSTNFYSYYF